MYVPSYFAEMRPQELHRMMLHNPLGALVHHGLEGLDATHLPFELDDTIADRVLLRAHVARANPIWKQVVDEQQVLVIFRAMDAYISPNWYPSKQDDHRQVPTWNYQVVNVHGKIRIIDDEKFVRGVVARLTRLHEARVDQIKPWRMSDAPQEYIDAMLQDIVGIEIQITKMLGKSKLSQNRQENDRVGVAEQLKLRGRVEISEAMRKR